MALPSRPWHGCWDDMQPKARAIRSWPPKARAIRSRPSKARAIKSLPPAVVQCFFFLIHASDGMGRRIWPSQRIDLPLGKPDRALRRPHLPTLLSLTWNYFFFLLLPAVTTTGWPTAAKSNPRKLLAFWLLVLTDGRLPPKGAK